MALSGFDRWLHGDPAKMRIMAMFRESPGPSYPQTGKICRVARQNLPGNHYLTVIGKESRARSRSGLSLSARSVRTKPDWEGSKEDTEVRIEACREGSEKGFRLSRVAQSKFLPKIFLIVQVFT